MGEIADMIIDGVCCSLCQHLFNELQGYPCVCKECWNILTKEEKENHQLAHEDKQRGE